MLRGFFMPIFAPKGPVLPIFRKKPVEIEAIHLDNHTTPEQVARWCGGRVATPTVGVGCPIVIEIDTLEGVMTAHPGDWIIKGTQGEFYPCKPAAFADTFEAV